MSKEYRIPYTVGRGRVKERCGGKAEEKDNKRQG